MTYNENKEKKGGTTFGEAISETKKGGSVLASGGFGCVFSPALKCEGTQKREINKVSKLMTRKHAIDEYDEIATIKEQLDTVKNYADYFVIDDINLCKPNKLTSDDMFNYKQKCSALPKDKITPENMNKSLDKLLLINIPNGGAPIDDYVFECDSFENLYKLNVSLIKLLKNGIIPMNKRNVYHCDIKDSNVLIDKDFKTRLIDWGLSTTYIPTGQKYFPDSWRERPLQYNVPFSIIIFTEDFFDMFNELVNGSIPNKQVLTVFVKQYIQFWMKERGRGHYEFINEILIVLNDANKNDKEYAMQFIVSYIVETLALYAELQTKQLKTKKVSMRNYLNNVFIRNVDVWGFVMIYYPFIEFLQSRKEALSPSQTKLLGLIKRMISTNLFKTPKPINMPSLFRDLEAIGTMLKQESKK